METKVGRPAQLSRERIVAAVAGLPDVDGLSMRALAAELGVSHGALYRWVKNRDELFDLIGDVMVERIVADAATGRGWRRRLTVVATSMRTHFLQVHGYASHLSRPHEHNAHALDRLRSLVIAAFTEAGVAPELAEQSWYIFVTAVVGWLAFEEQGAELSAAAPRFDLFLGVLLRGLPARG